MREFIQNNFAEPDDPAAIADEPLAIHMRSKPTRNRTLIVFVHGLGGSRYGNGATWGRLPGFVFEDFPNVDVGLYDYVTLSRRVRFWESIHLSQEAVVFADLIRDVVPYQAVILVGHSMGGLLCQAAIGSLVNSAQDAALEKIGGMVLMASPQLGSQRVPAFLGLFSKDAYALRPHGEFVTSIQRTLADRLWLLEAEVPPAKRYSIPTWAILGSSDFWVDQLSANIGLPRSQTKKIRGSHTQIVKPGNKQHDGYDYLSGCIRKIIARQSAPTEGQRRAEERNIVVRIPPSRIPAIGVFLDRTEITGRLTDFLKDRSRTFVVIAGLPGIGKSALAAKLARDSAPGFNDIFWMTCSREQSTVDLLLGQLYTFLERNGDESLRGLWNAPSAALLPAKIDTIVEALSKNRYLLIFDEFASWLDERMQVRDADSRRVLHGLVSSSHLSKIILITERRPFFDPQSSPIPPGIMQSEELFGLSDADALSLLQQYLPSESEKLLKSAVETCGANPRMLNWFGYLVASGRQDVSTLLATGGAELSTKLLNGAIDDLNSESREALERLSIFRKPLTRSDLDYLHVPFQKAIMPLLDRFLGTLSPQDDSVSLAESTKTFVRSRLGAERLYQLHLEAANFYAAKQPAAKPVAFHDVLPVLERAYHLAQVGREGESADAFMEVSSSLAEWGYPDLVEQEVDRIMGMVKTDPLRRAWCLWTLAEIQDLRSRFPEALALYSDASQAFEAAQSYEGQARCHWRIGRVRNALGEFSAALDEFQLCTQMCDSQGITGPKAGALLDQGWTVGQQGDRDRALALMNASLELATRSGDFQTQASANRQIGWILWDYQRETARSRESYQRAMQIATSNALLKELGAVHGDLGYLQQQWGDTQAAKESCLTAIKIREALGDQYGLAGAYLSLGLVFHDQNEFAEERRCYDQSLSAYRLLKVPNGEAEVLLRQGVSWREQGQFSESEEALKEALHIAQDHSLALTLSDVLHQLGRTVFVIGRKAEAHTWLRKAVEEADKIKSPRAAEFEDHYRIVLNET